MTLNVQTALVDKANIQKIEKLMKILVRAGANASVLSAETLQSVALKALGEKDGESSRSIKTA
jgi:hypothetical protein